MCENTGPRRNVVLMFVHRLRRWTNIKTTLGQPRVLKRSANQSAATHVTSHMGGTHNEINILSM